MDADVKLCLQQWGMDKCHPLLHLRRDTSLSFTVLMQGNCFCAFNGKSYCMKVPGGMLKNRLNNAFPRTTEGFFLSSSFPVGERCHLMSWKPCRSCSLTFFSACYDHVQSQNHRIVGVGRDLCGSPSPTPLPKQGHLQ